MLQNVFLLFVFKWNIFFCDFTGWMFLKVKSVIWIITVENLELKSSITFFIIVGMINWFSLNHSCKPLHSECIFGRLQRVCRSGTGSTVLISLGLPTLLVSSLSTWALNFKRFFICGDIFHLDHISSVSLWQAQKACWGGITTNSIQITLSMI